MDLSKLTPAPLAITGFDTIKDGQTDPTPDTFIVGSDDTWIAQMLQKDCETDAELFVLGANAFDIWMRRKWTVTKELQGWSVTGKRKDGGIEFIKGNDVEDPFTAIIETEEWYKENVEKKCRTCGRTRPEFGTCSDAFHLEYWDNSGSHQETPVVEVLARGVLAPPPDR